MQKQNLIRENLYLKTKIRLLDNELCKTKRLLYDMERWLCDAIGFVNGKFKKTKGVNINPMRFMLLYISMLALIFVVDIVGQNYLFFAAILINLIWMLVLIMVIDYYNSYVVKKGDYVKKRW